MKRNAIFLLVVMAVIFGLFTFTWGTCPEQPNDRGQCDTLYVEEVAQDVAVGSQGPYLVRVPFFITHDVEYDRDSLWAFCITLCFSHTNPSKYCSLSAYTNSTFFNHPGSIFRNLVVSGNTIHNWMMDLYQAGQGQEWNSMILNLDGASHFWLVMIASGAGDLYFGEGSRILLGTMTLKMQDTMRVCVDSCFWPPSTRLAFTRSDAVSYIPRDNMPHCFTVKQAGSISGTKFNDIDGNGIQDPGETGLARWMITIEPGQWADLTDDNGNYSISFVQANTYTVNEVHKPYWEQTYPVPPGTYVIPVVLGQTVTGKNFGNRVLFNVQDLSITVEGTRPRINSKQLYGISYQNKGTVTTNSTVILTLPSQVIYLESSLGGVYNGYTHNVTWDVGALAPGFMGWLWSRDSVPDTGTGLTFTATARIEPISSDAYPRDNTDTSRQSLFFSYDPNEKLVTPEGSIDRTDMLRYVVYFQNVGNDTAFNVVVRDTLDDNLDITTLENGASSHPYVFDIAGRELSWTFANINLPDSTTDEGKSQGFVSFRVSPKSTVSVGTDIQNRAGIYFDYNTPVITNTVHSIIMSICGDVNSDDLVDVGDVVYLINYLFKGGAAPNPLQNGDVNRDGVVDVGDVVYLINYLFKGGLPPCS